MRIALFTETYLPFINGVVTHVASLKSGLEQLGHEVLVVTASADTKHHYIEDGVLYCPAIESKKMYNYGIAAPLSNSRIRILREFNPDVVHIHSEFGVGLSGMHIAKLFKIPLIYTLHTMYDDYIYYVAPKFLAPVVKNFSHRYAWVLAHNASALTGPSKKVDEYFSRCHVKKEVDVIPNPVELDKFCLKNIDLSKVQQIREKYGLSDKELVVCFCGRIGKEKSIDKLLEYWKECSENDKSIHLMIFGDGPIKDELVAEAENLGLSDSVTFTGKVPHDELPTHYAACDIYVTASLSDTNSISMLEAMAMGLPVLHIKDELNGGQIVDNINGYIYNDGQDLSRIITEFKHKSLTNVNLLKASSRKSVENAGSLTLANTLLEIYADKIKHNKNRKIISINGRLKITKKGVIFEKKH